MNDHEIFKALGELSRIKIIKLLSIKRMYVCEIEAILDMSQPRISQHLKVLRQAKLVNMEKDGQRTVYSLDRDMINSFFLAFNHFLDAPLDELPSFQEYDERMKEVEQDPSVTLCKYQ